MPAGWRTTWPQCSTTFDSYVGEPGPIATEVLAGARAALAAHPVCRCVCDEYDLDDSCCGCPCHEDDEQEET